MRECQQKHLLKLSELLSLGDRATSTTKTNRKLELASGYQRLVAVRVTISQAGHRLLQAASLGR